MSELNETSPRRDANGRFLAGCSGNPAGKRPGTRNCATLLREALNDGEDRTAARMVIDKALAGNLVAARFVVDRLMPRPRGREITLDLPDGASARDVVTAYDATVQAMATGEITPEEALTVTRVLDGRLRALKVAAREEEKIARAHRKEPSPPGRGQGEGAGRFTAGADGASSRRPHPDPLPVGEGMVDVRAQLARAGRGGFIGDLLHSTCISTSPGWRFGLAA